MYMARIGMFKGEDLNVSAESIWHMLFSLLKKIKPYWKLAVITAVAMAMIATIEFFVPQLIQYTIDDVIPAGDTRQLLYVFSGFIGAALLLVVFRFISSYLLSRLGQYAVFSMRHDLYTHLIKQDIAYFDRNRTGDLMSRLTGDVNALQKLISSDLLDIITSTGVFIVVSIYMFVVNWQLTLVLYFTFPLFFIITKFFSKRIRAIYRHVQRNVAQMTNHLQDSLTSIRLMKSFTNEPLETAKFAAHNEANMEANLQASYVTSMYSPLIGFINAVGLAIVVVIGALAAIQGDMTTGAIFAFVAYLRLVQAPITKVTRFIRELQQAAASYDRIMEVMRSTPTIEDTPNSAKLLPMERDITFEHVHFSYDGVTPILNDVNVTFKKGEMTAIVGSSGSGKTTITSLLQRFYDPTAGEIKLDGAPITTATLASLREQLVVVAQDIQLFSGTLYENLAYGNAHATKEDIIAAAKAANAHAFILAFPDGYNTQIGERGVKLSGGQKQRISIARALLKNPHIIVLDEATAALDTESENLIQQSLQTLLHDKTSIVIAHRLSTVRMAHNIIVVEQGRIVETGTHEGLLEKGGRYGELYHYQFPQHEKTLSNSKI